VVKQLIISRKMKNEELLDELEAPKIRFYEKHELAQLYFPDSKVHAARQRLHRWIYGCPELMQELRRCGFKPASPGFSPREVGLVFQYLGTP
jgi:hypothetical protein